MKRGETKRRHRSTAIGSLVIVIILLISECALLNKFQTGLEGNAVIEQKIAGQAMALSSKRSPVVDALFTSKKELSLTFNGMSDRDSMRKLLDELDKNEIKATFFLPGIRVAEEPDIAQLIHSRGHEIANNTLNQRDFSSLTYEEIVSDLQLSNDIFARELGFKPRFVRTRSGDYTDELRLAAAELGMDAVIHYSINPRVSDMQSAEEIGRYIERFIRRGSIIILHTDINPEVTSSIAYIADVAKRMNFTFVPLGEWIDNHEIRKPLEEIPGFDAARINLDDHHTDYRLIENIPNGQKEIAITFDDWGSDETIDKILDTLAIYDVRATFFVVGQGVEHNPNLAKTIFDAGHEMANHTYSHRIVTELTAEELQEEVVKTHQVIAEAIQEPPAMLFRPPTGTIDERSAQIIAATGYETIVNFDVTALDWDVNNSAEKILNTILEKTTDGSIILLHLHDGIHTAEALPHVLEQLIEQGYTFVTVSELLRHHNE